MIASYIMLGILLVCAVIIIVAVTLQKTSEDGLSSTIAGGADTYYGKEKAATGQKKLYKWTMIASIIFAVAVLAAYVIQPDYSANLTQDWDEKMTTEWQDTSDYSDIFDHSHS